jgi:hypothetical protein
MKRIIIALPLIVVLGLSFGCAKKQKFHQTDLPDPESYVACFRDIDTDGDGTVTWEEFKGHFSQAEPRVFEILDVNEDKAVDHDEWHTFEEAHGAKHKHGSISY